MKNETTHVYSCSCYGCYGDETIATAVVAMVM